MRTSPLLAYFPLLHVLVVTFDGVEHVFLFDSIIYFQELESVLTEVVTASMRNGYVAAMAETKLEWGHISHLGWLH